MLSLKFIRYFSIVAILLSFAFSFSSCVKDTCVRTFSISTPIMQTLTEARKSIHATASQPVTGSGKIYIYNNYIFLNKPGKGVHIIDNKNPSMPVNLSFINIPGNKDIAVKGDYLYADDAFGELVVLNIKNPLVVTTEKFLMNIFYPSANNLAANPDSVKVVTGYTYRDTTVDCASYTRFFSCPTCSFSGSPSLQNSTASAGGSKGMGGSMSRFAISNDRLYAVTTSEMKIVDIAIPQNPVYKSSKSLNNFNIETIFPFKDKLFIGSSNGMFIYDITDMDSPKLSGQFAHITLCDPVVADDNYAYVTLRTGSFCAGTINRLDVLSISNISSPQLIKSYNLTNPHGLCKDENLLFVCDGTDGLKIYDATQADDLKLVKFFGLINTYDVIAYNKKAIVVTDKGILQYSYADKNNITRLSTLNFVK